MDATQTKILDALTQAIKTAPKTRPWVTLSYGMSLDGKIATYTGDSKYITGPEGRLFVHELRDRHDAILVGIQTVMNDHPLLTTRLQDRKGKDAHRIILDSQLRIDLNEPILKAKSTATTYVVTKAHSGSAKQQKLKDLGVKVWIDPSSAPHIDLAWLITMFQAEGILSVLVEGGGTIHESFIKANLFDWLCAQISPLLIGGKDAKTPIEGQGFATLKEATRVAFDNLFMAGDDIILVSSNLNHKK